MGTLREMFHTLRSQIANINAFCYSQGVDPSVIGNDALDAYKRQAFETWYSPYIGSMSTFVDFVNINKCDKYECRARLDTLDWDLFY